MVQSPLLPVLYQRYSRQHHSLCLGLYYGYVSGGKGLQFLPGMDLQNLRKVCVFMRSEWKQHGPCHGLMAMQDFNKVTLSISIISFPRKSTLSEMRPHCCIALNNSPKTSFHEKQRRIWYQFSRLMKQLRSSYYFIFIRLLVSTSQVSLTSLFLVMIS